MSSNKKLKYTNIDIDSVISTKCANITLRLQTLKNNYVEMNTRVHIVSQLKYNIIIDVATLKPNNITLF